MNDHIKKLLADCGAHEIHDTRGFTNRYHYAMTSDNIDVFVEAIVNRCLDVSDNYAGGGAGSEFDLGMIYAAEAISCEIRKAFGYGQEEKKD